MRPLFTLTLTFTFTLTFSSLRAQEGVSRPVGYLVQTIPAGQSRSFSVPLDADVSSQANAVGKLTAVGADYLENSAANWTPGAFSAVEAPYFVRFTSGAEAGRIFRIATTANTATRLYVADDGVGLGTLGLTTGADGTRFEIMPADTLLVWNGAGWYSFFYNDVAGHWRRVGDSTDRDGYVIKAGTPVFVQRRAAGLSASDKTVSFPQPGN